ncbi:MAG: hypothetical protein KY432_07960, partial [Acidobacteria bacterium]|nr:hypothetical protein [Acidobacteriota bacterium]
VVLKQVSLILRELKGIHHLSTVTLKAAHGMAANLEKTPSLPSLDEPSAAFLAAAHDLRTAVESMERKIAGISPGMGSVRRSI